MSKYSQSKYAEFIRPQANLRNAVASDHNMKFSMQIDYDFVLKHPEFEQYLQLSLIGCYETFQISFHSDIALASIYKVYFSKLVHDQLVIRITKAVKVINDIQAGNVPTGNFSFGLE